MAQMKFGNCPAKPQVRTTFLDFDLPFYGTVQKKKSAGCLAPIGCDVSKFGSGDATANIGTLDYTGIPNNRFNGDYDVIPTMEGSVRLPKESERVQYMPSVDQLHFLTTQQGSRLQPLPKRWFK